MRISFTNVINLKKDDSGTKSKQGTTLSIQIILIFVIIISALIGSALFFAYLNTNSMRKYVENETIMASGILSSNIAEKIQAELVDREEAAADGDDFDYDIVSALPEGELVKRLSDIFTAASYRAGADSDVWVINQNGNILYASEPADNNVIGEIIPQDVWQSIAVQKGADEEAALFWIGKRNLFLMHQSLCVVQPINDDNLYLVIHNRCQTIIANQRQQFALFAGIEMILILLIVILLANTIFSYRRKIIRLATMDELTGLANRKSFRSSYSEYMKELKAGKPEVFSLFLMDIDFFKQVNDTYGHSAGDKAIQTLAKHIQELVKEYGGFAGRWGGDEFIGVLPLSGPEAHNAISRLCKGISVQKCDGEFFITVSAGVVQDEGSTRLSHLSEMADLALYTSKENGRNQVSLYTGEQVREMLPPKAVQAAAVEAGLTQAEEDFDSVFTVPVSGEKGQRLRERLVGYLKEKLVSSTLLGVKWMAPFIAGGGLLIGIAFLFDASAVDITALSMAERTQLGSITQQAALLKSIGDSTFNFMLPVFAGFMAYGIAGERAFLAGFVGGFMTIQSNSGFIGAMIAGFIAGVLASEMEQFIGRLPRVIQKAAPIIIFPIFSLLLMQVIASLIISPISGLLGDLFRSLLDFVTARNANLSGALAGGMMAIDMGGIINKVAYNYGVNGLAYGETGFMASVMAGGMVPPIGVALSMLLFRKKYTQEERERGIGTFFMGLSFITEGVLPFVFTDVGRVIPACIAGSALAGLLSSLLGCTLPAPHGGIFVIPVMGHSWRYILAIAAGSLLTAVILGRWKKEMQVK